MPLAFAAGRPDRVLGTAVDAARDLFGGSHHLAPDLCLLLVRDLQRHVSWQGYAEHRIDDGDADAGLWYRRYAFVSRAFGNATCEATVALIRP
jgi:hypothetical protein